MSLTSDQRDDLQERLAASIFEVMPQNLDMIWEAIVDGRVGLAQMSDDELVAYARDVWPIEMEDNDGSPG